MKRTTKVMTWISVVLLAGVILLAGTKTDAEPQNRLTGSWIRTEGTFEDGGESFPECEYIFRPNGMYSYRNDYMLYRECGSYSLEGDSLTLTRDDGGQERYVVTFLGDELSWEDEGGCQMFARDTAVFARATAEK